MMVSVSPGVTGIADVAYPPPPAGAPLPPPPPPAPQALTVIEVTPAGTTKDWSAPVLLKVTVSPVRALGVSPNPVSCSVIRAAAEVTVTMVMGLVQFPPSADTSAAEKLGGVRSGGLARIVTVLVTVLPVPFEAVNATWLVPSATNCASSRPEAVSVTGIVGAETGR